MTNAAHGIKAAELCTQHLNSAHAEIHQENGYLKRFGPRSNHLGHVRLGQYIPELVDARHEELAAELDRRAESHPSLGGHDSPLKAAPVVDAGLFGFPVEALRLYQRNVFRSKSCECLQK